MSDLNVSDHIKTEHNRQLYEANQELKRQVNELVEFQIANPQVHNPTTREEIEREKEINLAIEKRKKAIRGQLTVLKSMFRQSVMKVREEKAQTTESRNVNDTLILQLHNLKYEEQSLSSEISAAQNYDHKYTKLPLIPVEEFLELFPEHKESSEHDLMTARIEHEYQVRMKLEERRQEKLKQKQMLIAEVKKRKDDLTKLDGMLETFIEAADPIQKLYEENSGFGASQSSGSIDVITPQRIRGHKGGCGKKKATQNSEESVEYHSLLMNQVLNRFEDSQEHDQSSLIGKSVGSHSPSIKDSETSVGHAFSFIDEPERNNAGPFPFRL